MPFDNQLTTINQMIESATELIDSNIEFDLYINEMIKQFFPEGNINVVKKMCEWAKYSNLHIISFKELQEIEINERTTIFKEKVKDTTLSQNEINTFNYLIKCIRDCTLFGTINESNKVIILIYAHELVNWDQIINAIQNYKSLGFGRYYNCQNNIYPNNLAENIIHHTKFTNTILSLWKGNIIHKNFEKSIEALTLRVNNLENENKILREQIDNNHIKTNMIQLKLDGIQYKYAPELIKYNYNEIKSRLDPIRKELQTTQRIFTRLIRNNYEVPFAIVVNKHLDSKP